MQNAAAPDVPRPKLLLLEHDDRFAMFPEFVFYDFAQPLKLPGSFPLLPLPPLLFVSRLQNDQGPVGC